MAATIIGGLIASTLLTLVVVPAAYVLINPVKRTASPRRRKSAAPMFSISSGHVSD
jgi:hypothetical protein